MYHNCNFDQQERCNRVLHPEQKTDQGVSHGMSSAACYKVHISTQPPSKLLHGNLLNRKSSNYTKLNTTRYQGSAASSHSSSFLGVYKLDVFRTSAKLHRMVRGPQFINRNPPLEDYKIEAIQNYLDYSGLRVLTDEEIRRNCSTRGQIDSFSRKSRQNLKFLASNCVPEMISQFCLTYPDSCVPSDGRETKKHLNRFLTSFRRHFPLANYLWVLEFQTKRGVPHYHLFMSFVPDHIQRSWLAFRWLEVIDPAPADREKCFKVHNHPRNCIAWDMGKGGYLSNKYLAKESQKAVPAGFLNVGRFWGSSRSLAPSPECIDLSQLPEQTDEIDQITGEITTYDYNKTLLRAIRRHHESSMRSCGIKKKSRLVNQALTTVKIPSGGLIYQKHLRWWYSMTYKNHEEAPF